MYIRTSVFVSFEAYPIFDKAIEISIFSPTLTFRFSIFATENLNLRIWKCTLGPAYSEQLNS